MQTVESEKSISAERAGSKALKTLALCWAYRKHAFSVSGNFRKLLTDLINSMHNSNNHLVQVSLSGAVLPEQRYSVLGFVPIEIIGLYRKFWFFKLNHKQVVKVTGFFNESKQRSW